MFGHRAFAYYWIGRIVSILSFQMLMVAIGWQLYSITGSALDLGLIGLAQFVPMLVLTLLVGHVADRYDYRAILLVCQSGEAIAAAFLAAGSLMGWLDPWAIYAVTALVGAARAFEIPTMVAIIPALVPRPLVPAATAWFTSANQAGQIVGPVLGGLLYAFGPAAVYGTAIVLWAVGACFIAMIRMERAPRSAEPLTLRSAMGGFRFVMRDRVILGTIALDMCAVFLAGLGTLFPIFARDILKTGPWGLGLLRAAPAVGALVMSVVLARRPLTLPIGQVLFGVIAVFGLFTVAVRALDQPDPVAGGARRAGRRRRGQRGDPLLAGAAAHPAGDARPGQRGERHVHRHLQLSRRFPRRRGRGAARRAAGRRRSAGRGCSRCWRFGCFFSRSCGVSVRWTRCPR